MGYLPDIDEKGQLILTKEERKVISMNTIDPEKKKKLAEYFAKKKAKADVEELKKVDGELAKLNNEGRKEVTEDFEDSPHADREPIKNEDDEEDTTEEEE